MAITIGIEEAIVLSNEYISRNDDRHLKYTIFCADNGVKEKMWYLTNYYIKNKDMTNSIKYFDKLYTEFNDKKALHHICECIYYQTSCLNIFDKDIMSKYYDILIKFKDELSSQVFVFLGNAFSDMNLNNKMIKLYEIAIQKEDYCAMFLLGEYYLSLNNPLGVEYLKIASNHNNYDSTEMLASYYFDNDEFSKSKFYYEKLFTLWKADTNSYLPEENIIIYESGNIMQSLSYLEYGYLCHIDGDIEAVEKNYNEYINIASLDDGIESIIGDIKNIYKTKNCGKKINFNQIKHHLIY